MGDSCPCSIVLYGTDVPCLYEVGVVMSLAWWLMEVGTWFVAIGLTFGLFAGLLWLGAFLIGER